MQWQTIADAKAKDRDRARDDSDGCRSEYEVRRLHSGLLHGRRRLNVVPHGRNRQLERFQTIGHPPCLLLIQ